MERRGKENHTGQVSNSDQHFILYFFVLFLLKVTEELFCLFVGIGGFMVRQRKCHTRMRKSLNLSGEGVSEGQAAESKLEEGKFNQHLTAYRVKTPPRL